MVGVARGFARPVTGFAGRSAKTEGTGRYGIIGETSNFENVVNYLFNDL